MSDLAGGISTRKRTIEDEIDKEEVDHAKTTITKTSESAKTGQKRVKAGTQHSSKAGGTKSGKAKSDTSKKQMTLSSYFTKKDPTITPKPHAASPSSNSNLENKLTQFSIHSSPSGSLASSPKPKPVEDMVFKLPKQDVRREKRAQSKQKSADNDHQATLIKRKRVVDSDSESDEDYQNESSPKRISDDEEGAEETDVNGKRDGQTSRTSLKLSSFSKKATTEAISDNGTTVNLERSRMRERFLEKFSLATVDSETTNEGNVEEEQDDDDLEKESLKPSNKSVKSKGPSASKKCAKYTPLELQYMEIKKKHPDCLLVVEVGYKFRFFEDDALIAAKELNIMAFKDKNFYGASIPVHRLNVHVKKLVQLGYKVGVVRQTETAAIKAAGDNRSAPFTRKLTNICTKGTFVDDFGEPDSVFDTKESYLLCLNEEPSKKGPDSVQITIIAVQLSTGEIIYDSFDDGLARSELETRLHHIQPIEIIFPSSLTSTTTKFVRHWSESSNHAGDGVRIEEVLQLNFPSPTESRDTLTSFFEKSSPGKQSFYLLILNLPASVLVCMTGLLSYLKEFGLEHVLLLTKSFEPFAKVGHMTLSGNTLSQLEIFESYSGTMSSNGSLFWVLNHTTTSFGRRLFRKWLAKPLIKLTDLNERVDAVEELLTCLTHEDVLVMKLKYLLTQLPDLEKSMARIHYGRCTPAELFSTLQSLEKVSTAFPPTSHEKFKSQLLQKVVKSFSSLKEVVQGYITYLNESATKSNVKADMFKAYDQFPDIASLKEELCQIDETMKSRLRSIRKLLKLPTLDYVSVSGTDYLIELKSSSQKLVPSDWVKVSVTKQAARYHPPDVLETINQRNIVLEQLSLAGESAFTEFVRGVATHYQEVREVIQSLAIVDCLLSLAKVASQPGYCKPSFLDEPIIDVQDGRHPIVETLTTNFVANDIHLKVDNCHVEIADIGQNEERCILITGPNMGGKSSYIRMVALIAIMGQIGSYVPAQSAQLGIFDSIFTRMGASDDIARGQSTFMKELDETSDILTNASERSLVILDELGRGTSTHDGTAIAYATLCYLLETVRCTTLFVTHYPYLGSLADSYNRALRCYHMGFIEHSEGEGCAPSITFLYKLIEGLATRSFGLNVARLAGLPDSVIQLAAEKSKEMEVSNNLPTREFCNKWSLSP